MSRLLHAAARGARIECWLLPQKKWIPAIAVRVADGLHIDYRIHPDDAHLQYGPISTALREMAEDYSWNPSWEHYAAHAVEDRFSFFDRHDGLDEPDYPLFYLILAEALADEGM
jgi:cell wall assembly regulator SMI1